MLWVLESLLDLPMGIYFKYIIILPALYLTPVTAKTNICPCLNRTNIQHIYQITYAHDFVVHFIRNHTLLLKQLLRKQDSIFNKAYFIRNTLKFLYTIVIYSAWIIFENSTDKTYSNIKITQGAYVNECITVVINGTVWKYVC